MKGFWLLFAGTAVGMVLTAIVVAAALWWFLACDGWSFC